jgi:hypothetical protein
MLFFLKFYLLKTKLVHLFLEKFIGQDVTIQGRLLKTFLRL